MRLRHQLKKCLWCKEWFEPDPRTRFHQRFCTKARCRKASKMLSQKQWLAKPENRGYWSGPEEVARVQEWRKGNPDYSHRKNRRK